MSHSHHLPLPISNFLLTPKRKTTQIQGQKQSAIVSPPPPPLPIKNLPASLRNNLKLRTAVMTLTLS